MEGLIYAFLVGQFDARKTLNWRRGERNREYTLQSFQELTKSLYLRADVIPRQSGSSSTGIIGS